MKYSAAADMIKDLEDYHNFSAPGVNVSCIHGTHVDTLERLDFDSLDNLSPGRAHGKGDGTVNDRSLSACSHWNNDLIQGEHIVDEVKLPGAEHYDILRDTRAINHILSRLSLSPDYDASSQSEPKKAHSTFRIRLF